VLLGAAIAGFLHVHGRDPLTPVFGRNAQITVIRRQLGEWLKSTPNRKFRLHATIGTFRR
jgi:hypothetical protein